MSRFALLLLCCAPLGLAACGGDGGRPDPQSGPYAIVSAGGSPGEVLALSSGFAVSCKPQAKIKQFDYEAKANDSADRFLRFSLKQWEGAKAYEIVYGKNLQPHTVEVGVTLDGKAHRYEYSEAVRSDGTVPSSCTITFDSDSSGTLTCLMLFAASGSPDFVDRKEKRLNGFADVYARFECN